MIYFDPGTVIKNECFSQDVCNSRIFEESMTGVIFINCNLDNVIVPEGNMVIDCSTRRFCQKIDGYDWEIDENGAPIERLNSYYLYEKFGGSWPTPEDLSYWEQEAGDWEGILNGAG